MEIRQYITIQEVQRVCSELGIRDWSSISEARVSLGGAEGDLLKAISGGDPDKIRKKYRQLVDARRALIDEEAKQIA